MSVPPTKSVRIKAERHRAIQRARLEIEERGEQAPSVQALVEAALLEWIQQHCPAALEPPPPGRPRKTPRKL